LVTATGQDGSSEAICDPMRQFSELAGDVRDPYPMMAEIRAGSSPVLEVNMVGTGPHRCLGMHLARLETTVLLNAVLDRPPNLRLDPAAEDPRIHGLTFCSPPNLPVHFDPASW